jgi:hypothetical protein
VDLKEIVWESVDWINLAQESCGDGNELSGFIKVGECLD